jgi:hypothetical protein
MRAFLGLTLLSFATAGCNALLGFEDEYVVDSSPGSAGAATAGQAGSGGQGGAVGGQAGAGQGGQEGGAAGSGLAGQGGSGGDGGASGSAGEGGSAGSAGDGGQGGSPGGASAAGGVGGAAGAAGDAGAGGDAGDGGTSGDGGAAGDGGTAGDGGAAGDGGMGGAGSGGVGGDGGTAGGGAGGAPPCTSLPDSVYVNPTTGEDNPGNGSCETPFRTLGFALNELGASPPTTTIRLAAGTYSGSSNGEQFPLNLSVPNVSVVGEGPGEVLIRGGGSSTSFGGETCTLVISAPISELQGISVENPTGHGICSLSPSLDMANVRVEKCAKNGIWQKASVSGTWTSVSSTFSSGGNGLFISGDVKDPVGTLSLDACDFSSNFLGGLSSMQSITIESTNSKFKQNKVGGAVFNLKESFLSTGDEFDSNGVGISIGGPGSPKPTVKIGGGKFLGNSTAGISALSAQMVRVRDSLFHGNTTGIDTTLVQPQMDLGSPGDPGGNVLQAKGALANKKVGVCYRGTGLLAINGNLWSSCPVMVASNCEGQGNAGVANGGTLSIMGCEVAP